MKAREDEGGRTVDVMRFLVMYGLDHITGAVKNKPCLNKVVKESVRRLLKEMVRRKLEKVAEQYHSSSQETGRINVPMKQGDWLCPK